MMFAGGRRVFSRTTIAAVAVVGIVAVAGCSQSGPSVDDSATSGDITWWGWTPEIGVGESYIAAFNEEYPDIKVTYKQVATAEYDSAIRPALASNVGPDVYNMAPGGGLGGVGAYGDFALDLTPAVEEALGADWESQLVPLGPAGLTDANGRLAALPVGSTFAGTMWYNPEIFEKVGVSVPTTLGEWIDVCEKMADAGQICFEQGAGDNGFNQDLVHSIAETYKPGAWAAAIDGSGSWTDPALVSAFSDFRDMFDNGIMQPGALGMQQYPDVNNDFISGKAAMVLMGTWYMQYSTVAGAEAAVEASGVAGAEPFPIMAAPFPDVAGLGNPAPLFGDPDFGVGVNAKSKFPKAAQTFVTWLTTSETAQQLVANALNDTPSLASISPKWDDIDLVDAAIQQPVLDELITRSIDVSDQRLGNLDSATGEAIGAALQAVATKDKTPEQALGDLELAQSGE